MEVKGCSKRNRWHFCENIGTVWNGVRPALRCLDITCPYILSFGLKDFSQTEQNQLVSTPQEQNVDWERGRMLSIYIGLQAIKFQCFLPPPPPPHSVLFSLHHHHHHHRHHHISTFTSPSLIQLEHISIPEENKRILLPYKDALLDLARPNVPHKTKKRVLVQEVSGFIEDVLAPVVSSLEFLMR